MAVISARKISGYKEPHFITPLEENGSVGNQCSPTRQWECEKHWASTNHYHCPFGRYDFHYREII